MERDVRNRVVFVTGATSGIGKETARQLAALGVRVAIGARDWESGERAGDDIVSAGDSPVEVVAGDLSVTAGVRGVAAEFQKRFDRLDALIHNAGVDVGQRAETADGFELTFAVNFLAPFLLTRSLLALLKASAPARVLTIVSSGHRGGHLDFDDLQHERHFSGQRAYNDSKLALVLFTYELARRLQGSGVTANCVDPGFVRGTNIGRTLPFAYRAVGALLLPFMTTPPKAAVGVTWAATARELTDVSGVYLKRGKQASSSKESREPDLARRLWEVTEKLVKHAE